MISMGQSLEKQFVNIFLLIFFLGLFTTTLLNYIGDPFQYYRYSPEKPLNGNDRWQVAGFVRTFDYNQIVLGTSMTQNFSLATLKEAMQAKPIRLSVAGLSIQEQAIILQAALKRKCLDSVIWGIDRNYLTYERGKFDPSFPIEIYRQSVKGHLQYLLNISTLSSSCKYISRLWRTQFQDLENYNSWHPYAHYSRKEILKLYHHSMDQFLAGRPLELLNIEAAIDEQTFQKNMAKEIENFHQDVLAIIKANPNIQFHIFFPPYSLAYYKIQYYADPKRFFQDAQLRQYIMRTLISLPNVKFHDFETEGQIVADLDNYKDLTHYSKNISEWIIRRLAQGCDTVTLSNIDRLQKRYLVQPKNAI